MSDPSDPEHDEQHSDGKEPLDGAFDDLPVLRDLGERLASYYRADQATKRRRRRRWRSPLSMPHLRPALLVALTLLFASGAAAAVTLSVRGSAPLSGRIPPEANAARWGFGFTEAGAHYRIAFAPMLTAGDAGWRSFIYIGRAGRRGGSASAGGYPTAGAPLVLGGGYFTTTSVKGGSAIQYVLTGPAVAAVRVGAETILTRRSSALPAGDRIAVFTVPVRREPLRSRRRSTRGPGAKTGRSGVGSTPGPGAGPGRSGVRSGAAPRRTRPGRLRAASPPRVLALGHGGAPLRSTGSGTEAPRLPTQVWTRADSTSTGDTAKVSPPDTAGVLKDTEAGACALHRHGLPALTPQLLEVALELRPVEHALGELMRSCLQATYTLYGSQLRASILLDARNPGSSVPGPIPGAKPLKGHRGVVDAPLGPAPGGITAKRDGKAWLVVEGGTSVDQRLAVLNALSIAKVDAVPAPRP